MYYAQPSTSLLTFNSNQIEILATLVFAMNYITLSPRRHLPDHRKIFQADVAFWHPFIADLRPQVSRDESKVSNGEVTPAQLRWNWGNHKIDCEGKPEDEELKIDIVKYEFTIVSSWRWQSVHVNISAKCCLCTACCCPRNIYVKYKETHFMQWSAISLMFILLTWHYVT